MTKVPRIRSIVIVPVLLALMAWAGCGGQDTVTRTYKATQPRDIESVLNDLDNLQATVEVSQNGQTIVTWSQKDGSWRWQDPDDPDHYVIYNADMGTAWEVQGGSASVVTGTEGLWKAKNPSSFMRNYTLSSGPISGEKVEIKYPFGIITVEFLGPKNLPSKMVIEEEGVETKVLEYTYTDIDDVPDSMFELPPDVVISR
ncbi:hypothetical protein BMS3Abin01_00766 [bacterium BMS3Abin01]|nr:hypothetical protein BMS3Abin01_00766 [bacterium BMS3Abin01]